VSDAPLSEKQIRDTLAAYLGLLQRHVSAEEMMSKILTDDFVEVAGRSDDEVEIKTRLEFFLRRWEPPSPTSDEFTGWAFHTWILRRSAGQSEWRVAAQLVDGFDHLNDNAKRLFSTPEEGLKR